MRVLQNLLKMVVVFWKWALLSILLGWATVASWVALIGTSSYLISYAALQPSIAELQVAIVGVRFFGISRGVLRYLERLVSHNTTFKILTEMRVKFFSVLEEITPSGMQDYFSGDLLARIIDDIETLQEFYVRVIYPPFVAFLSTVGIIWFFGRWSWQFGVIILLFHLFSGILVPILILILTRKPGSDLVNNGAELRQVIVDGLGGIAEITAFGKEQVFRQQIENFGKKRISSQRKMHIATGLQNGLIALGVNLCMVVILLVAIPMVRDGSLDGKLLAVVVLGSSASFEAVMLMPVALQSIGASYQAGKRLSDIIENSNAISVDEGNLSVGMDFSLKVENLTFAYPDKGISVLQRISFDLPLSKKIGIVGISGVGKTTLLNLLLRHWDITDNAILLNGVDIKKFSSFEVRKKIAVVNQQVYLFNSTILENIKLGNYEVSDDEVVEASKAAGAHAFISRLPAGYHTVVGEQGAFISGGETQRLGITRALIKPASLYLLDEPLAHLDAIIQKEVMTALLEYLADKSVLLVTHQIRGLSMMDEIILLDEGRIVERGKHTELIRAGGIYSGMWQNEQELLKD